MMKFSRAGKRAGKAGVSLLVLCLVAGVPVQAMAQQASGNVAGATTVHDFNIAAKPLLSALTDFSAVTGIQFVRIGSQSVSGRSAAVRGRYTSAEALERLLSNSGLAYRFNGAQTIVLGQPDEMTQRAASSDGAAGGTVLQTITVTGNGGATGRVDGYVARESVAGTKTDTPIMETARAVEVIGTEELEQRGAGSVIEAVRYSAGVATGGFGYDPRFDQIYVRGFALTTGGDFKDGLKQMASGYGMFRTDAYNLERLDIVKGPASALYGQSTPGGLVDRISKRPSDTPIREVMGKIDSTGRYQAGFDYGDILGDDDALRYRLVGLGRLGEGSHRVEDERFMLAPSFSFVPDEDTSFTIIGLAQHDETDGNVAALNRSGVVYDIRASDPDYDTQYVKQYQLGYEFKHRFTDTWTFRQNSRIGYVQTDAKYLTGSVTGGGWKVDGAGNPYYARGQYGLKDSMWSAQTDASLLAEFDTGPASHKLLFGVDHQSSWTEFLNGTAAASSQYDLYLNNPTYGRSGSRPALTAGTDTQVRQTGIYAQDQIEILDRWHANLGIRHDWASRRQQNHFTGAATAAQDDTAFTYNAGLLYELSQGVSVYGSYATSFLPTNFVDITGKPLEPSTGEQFEIGVKYQPEGFDGFFSLAAYHLKEQNVAKYAGNVAPVGSYYQSIGEVTTKGIEAQARANLAQGLDILASYTFNDAEITKDLTVANIGKAPMVTPRHIASLWLDYSFDHPALEGLQIGGGLRHIGETFTTNSNIAKNKAATLFDAAIRYDFGVKNPDLKGLTAAVNVTNIEDEKVATCNNGYCYLGEGRTVSATLKYRW